MNIKEYIKAIPMVDAKEKANTYDYALVYEISNMVCKPMNSISIINWDEVQEAYFFSIDGQLHVYRDEDELHAVCIEEPEQANYVDQKYTVNIRNNINDVGVNIIKREYLEYDEDGQINIVFSRLVPVKEV